MALYNNLPPPKDAGQEQITNIVTIGKDYDFRTKINKI